MNLFRSEEHVGRWLAGREPGATISVAKLAELAYSWWHDRLSPGWQPHSREQNQAILERLGLVGVRQWSGEPTADREEVEASQRIQHLAGSHARYGDLEIVVLPEAPAEEKIDSPPGGYIPRRRDTAQPVRDLLGAPGIPQREVGLERSLHYGGRRLCRRPERLPELDAVALGIREPAEAAELELLDPLVDLDAGGS